MFLSTDPLLPAMMLRAAVLLSLGVSAYAHGSMIMPPSRNSVDAELPAWANGKYPPTGLIEPYTCASRPPAPGATRPQSGPPTHL